MLKPIAGRSKRFTGNILNDIRVQRKFILLVKTYGTCYERYLYLYSDSFSSLSFSLSDAFTGKNREDVYEIQVKYFYFIF